MGRPLPDLPPGLLAAPRRTGDLYAAGVTRHQLSTDRWTSLFRGVHAWGGLDTDHTLARILAVASLLPAGGAIGGWAALYLHGVRDLDGRAGPGGRRRLPVPVCLGPTATMRPRPGIALDRRRLPDEDLTHAAGIVVTTAVRAVVDIMCRDGVEEGVVAGDAAARFGVAQPGQVRAYVRSHPRRRGVPAARTAAALLDARAASNPESRLRVVWVMEAGLPVPRVNVEVVDDSGFLLGVTDLLDLEAAMAGEYDGKDHRDLGRATSDNIREEGLERAGIVVVRATALDLWPRRAQLVQRLRGAHRDGLARDRSRDRWAVRR